MSICVLILCLMGSGRNVSAKPAPSIANRTNIPKQSESVCVQTNMTAMHQRRPSGFLFSTGNFSRCFRSILATTTYNRITINNATHGDFVFVARDYTKKAHTRQCDIKVTVPHDKIILFELLDLALPCRKATIEIKIPHIKMQEAAATFCGDYQKDKPENKFIVSSHTAVVSFIMYAFSTSHTLHLRCSAIPRSEDHHLQHIRLNEHKGYCLTL